MARKKKTPPSLVGRGGAKVEPYAAQDRVISESSASASTGTKLLHLSIMSVGDVMAERPPQRGYYLRAVSKWMDYHREHHGLCLCCCGTIERRTWPARFIFLRAYQSKRHWQVMVVCMLCACRADLPERVQAMVQRMYPSLDPLGRAQ